MASRFTRLARWFAPLLVLLLLVLLHPFWLGALAGFLISSEEPFPADLVAVMAGDWLGNRVRRAADLVRQGYAPKVLVSGLFLSEWAKTVATWMGI